MNTASMRLRNVTCLDHAFINDKGQVIGGSYHVSFDVSGRVDAQEQVVVDFSTIKKDLKAIIDHKETGYDHKLWFINGYSGGVICITPSDEISIVTPACELRQPRNSVRVFDQDFSGTFEDTVKRELTIYTQRKLLEKYPEVDIQVEVEITTKDFSTYPNSVQFRYSHGLKNSTSWGCQNLSHGHLSFAEWTYNEWFKESCANCQAGIKALNYAFEYVNNAILVFIDNVVNKDTYQTDPELHVRYETERGVFEALYKTSHNKIIIMPHETTIENIVAWFKRTFKGSLEMAHVEELFISEGLAKGAFARSEQDIW